MHHSGHDGGAGAIWSFDEGGTGGSGTCHVVPEDFDAACRSKMVKWAIERAEMAGRQQGGGGLQRGKRTEARWQ